MSELIHKIARFLHVDATSRDAYQKAWRRFIHWKPDFYRIPTEWGLCETPRKEPVIISLTSYPGRIGTVHETINTLLTQSVKPDRIVLWLAGSQFPKGEGELPTALLAQKKLGLEVRWCEDLRSYKKLLPALKAFPDAAIVTVDDDLFYHPRMLEELLASYATNPRAIHTQGAMQIMPDGKGGFLPYRQWPYSCELGCTKVGQLILGGSGTLYPPHCFTEEVFDSVTYKSLAPAADDMWFWVMAVRNGYTIRLAHGGKLGCATNYNANNESALWNTNQQSTNGNDTQFAKLLEHFADIF